VVITNKHTGGN